MAHHRTHAVPGVRRLLRARSLLVGTDVPPVGAVGVALGVSGTVTRTMAIPKVNDWIGKYLPFLAADGYGK